MRFIPTRLCHCYALIRHPSIHGLEPRKRPTVPAIESASTCAKNVFQRADRSSLSVQLSREAAILHVAWRYFAHVQNPLSSHTWLGSICACPNSRRATFAHVETAVEPRGWVLLYLRMSKQLRTPDRWAVNCCPLRVLSNWPN